MGLVISTMTEQKNIDTTIQEDFIKILGYIASVSFLLVVIFSIVYILFPQSASEFSGINIDFPHVDIINAILTYALSSVSNIFTYIFLVVVGIIAFVGAQYMEDQLPGKEQEQREAALKPSYEVEVLDTEKVDRHKPLVSHPYHVETKEELLHKISEAGKRLLPEKLRPDSGTKAVKATDKKPVKQAVSSVETPKVQKEEQPSEPISFSAEKKKAEMKIDEISKSGFFAEILEKSEREPAGKPEEPEVTNTGKEKETPLSVKLEQFEA